MNLYQKEVYRSHLEHALPRNPRRDHKYLYIDENGRYVYPEDVAKGAVNKAKSLHAKGQNNNINMRKARAESISAGNSKLANIASNKENWKKVGRIAYELSPVGRTIEGDRVIGDAVIGNKLRKNKVKVPKTKDNGELIKSAKDDDDLSEFGELILRKAPKAISNANAKGQANNVNMRKERAASIKAGNERIYKKIRKKRTVASK